MTQQDPTLLFLHIPKAAGSTIQPIAQRQYEDTAVYTFTADSQGSFAKLANMPAQKQNKIRFVKGHFNFGLHKKLHRPATYFTLLRDPIERTLSYYYFVKRNKHHYLYDQVTRENLNIHDVLKQQLTPDLDNGQVRLISGVWNDVPTGQCTAELLTLAKKNLKEKFTVVGLSEQFDESIVLLSQEFGWRNIVYVRQNVTPNRPTLADVDQETKKIIQTYNRLDTELYQYAQKLFQERIQKQGPFFKSQVTMFKIKNRLFNKTRHTPLIQRLWK